MYKSVNQLVMQDFRSNPIWHPIDDFQDPEMLAEPFLDTTLHLEEIYLIAIQVTLADQSEYEGYVRYSWGSPVMVKLSISDSEFVSFPAQRLAAKEDRHSEFLKVLNKKEDDVFPFTYRTRVEIRLEGAVY